MGKDLKGRELGKGILQRKNGKYCARYTNAFGKRIMLYGWDLKELKKQYNEKIYELDHHLNQIDESIMLFCKLNDASSSTLFSVKTGAVA